MVRPRYGEQGAAPATGTRSRSAGPRRDISPSAILQAVQSVAGNAAVSDALEGLPAEEHARRPGDDAATTRPAVSLRPPTFDLRLHRQAFHDLLVDHRVRSPRGIAALLAGSRGLTHLDWEAGTGATARDQPASYAAGRDHTTVQGSLEDFPGVSWSTGTGRRAARGGQAPDLHRVAPGRQTLTGNLRVRMAGTDLLREPTPVEVGFDGQGGLQLVFTLDDASLTMTATSSSSGTGGLAWSYTLELTNRRLATGIWDALPRSVRFGPKRVAEAAAPPPGDDEPPRDHDGTPPETTETPQPAPASDEANR